VSVYIKSRTYEAYASIYVERGAPPVAAGQQQAQRIVLDRKEVLNSEIDFMLSRAVIGKVADELLKPNPNAAKGPGPQPSLFMRALKYSLTTLHKTLIGGRAARQRRLARGPHRRLQSNLEAQPALLSNIITLSFEDDNGRNAARIVNTVTRIYLEERLKLIKRPGLYDFYQQQIDISRQLLDKLEAQERAIKENGQLVAATPRSPCVSSRCAISIPISSARRPPRKNCTTRSPCCASSSATCRRRSLRPPRWGQTLSSPIW